MPRSELDSPEGRWKTRLKTSHRSTSSHVIVPEPGVLHTLRTYAAKMQGGGEPPPSVGFTEIGWSWVGSLLGISLCSYLSAHYFEPQDLTLLLGSFGASAVLVYGAPQSPMAQPRHLLGGHMISGFMGVMSYQLWGTTPWLAAGLGVSLAIVAMLLTNTVHPPGGATALLAVIGGDEIHALGYWYVLIPAGAGAALLLLVALLVNNLARHRRYPVYWW